VRRYKTLHLSALGAAITHLATLAVSLPAALPYGPAELTVEYTTGTVEVRDELVPEDEDEDVSYRLRAKATLEVVFRLPGWEAEEAVPAAVRNTKGAAEAGRGQGKKKGGRGRGKGKGKGAAGEKEAPEVIVVSEPEQDEMEE
jgi:ribonuclease P/MRP protein subunit RPP20